MVCHNINKKEITIHAEIIKGATPENAHIIGGGLPNNPNWDEYLSDYTPEWHPHIIAIRNAIEKSSFMRATGEQFCNDHYFKLSDGSCWGFTWRAWGDLMQAIINKREGYMNYYM